MGRDRNSVSFLRAKVAVVSLLHLSDLSVLPVYLTLGFYYSYLNSCYIGTQEKGEITQILDHTNNTGSWLLCLILRFSDKNI